jgi:hypothetical protein
MLKLDQAAPLVLSLAAALTVGLAAHAAPVDTKVTTPCAFSAWSNETDPAGLDVHAAPRADAAIVAKLPASRKGTDYAVEFRVIGSRDGWLLIEKAKFVDYDGGGAETQVFAGPGWVSGTKVGFEINDARVFAAPDADAAVKAQLLVAVEPNGSYGPDSAVVDRVFSCSGSFADVQVHMPKGAPVRGWVARLCANQVTTCV